MFSDLLVSGEILSFATLWFLGGVYSLGLNFLEIEEVNREDAHEYSRSKETRSILFPRNREVAQECSWLKQYSSRFLVDVSYICASLNLFHVQPARYSSYSDGLSRP